MPFTTRSHARKVGAQQVAAAMHLTGYGVGKVVVLEVDGAPWLAVLSAPRRVDPVRLARLLGARQARLMAEHEFAPLFPDCEPGAEPPLGSLYGLRVAVDAELLGTPRLVFCAGSHLETLELRTADFVALEHPRVGRFGRDPMEAIPRSVADEEHAGATGG